MSQHRFRFVWYDLLCEKKHPQRKLVEVLGEDATFPLCEVCTHPTFPADEAQDRAAAAHTFKEFAVDDGVKITSPEGLQRYKEERARRLGVDPSQIILNDRGNVKERVEELRHRAIQTRRENGFDERTFADYRRERNRINAEKAARERGGR